MERINVVRDHAAFRLSDHQREVLRLAFDFDHDGRLPYDTIVYSCIKKSGKTTLNGALTLAWGFTQEAPNEILILANDLEQTKDFYCRVLGFEVMPRPNFPFPGYWLGVNGQIQVHMGPHGIDNAHM